MNAKKLASDILAFVGSEKNIISLAHCATRLRFTLNDNAVAQKNKQQIEALEGVITTVDTGGQFQVVIGNRVSEVYREIILLTGDQTEQSTIQGTVEKAPLISRFIDVISSVFTPLLGAMAAAGMLKGLLTIATATGLLSKTESTWRILWAASDGLFYFLPVLLAATAAKKFKCNIYVAMSIAAAMVYPDLINLAETNKVVEFFGIPVVMMKYTSSVIPIIISIWVMSLLENKVNRFVHEAVRSVLTPFILLSIMLPLTLATIGPASIWASNMLAGLFVAIYQFNPIICGGLFAASWQVLVIFGVHWGFAGVFMNDIAVTGRSYLKAATGPAVFAQAGAILAVMLKTDDPKMKTLSGSAFVSAIFGITEPGVYGITLKLKRPFICATVAAAIGGMIVGWAQSSALSMGMTGLLTLPIFYGPGFAGFIAGSAVAFILSVIFTWLFGVQKQSATHDYETGANAKLLTDEKAISETLLMPLQGRVIPLQDVSDRVFSSGVVGLGCAVIPDSGELYSPVDGVIDSVFDTGHAITILSDNGSEILIHVGIDTVSLGGVGFKKIVSPGERVKKGDLILQFDLVHIRSKGLDTTTPVIITNSENLHQAISVNTLALNVGDTLLTLAK